MRTNWNATLAAFYFINVLWFTLKLLKAVGKRTISQFYMVSFGFWMPILHTMPAPLTRGHGFFRDVSRKNKDVIKNRGLSLSPNSYKFIQLCVWERGVTCVSQRAVCLWENIISILIYRIQFTKTNDKNERQDKVLKFREKKYILG